MDKQISNQQDNVI